MHLRIRQIQISARALTIFTQTAIGAVVIRTFRKLPLGRPMLDGILGYYRVFPTLEAAERAAIPYANSGHQNPTNAPNHLEMNKSARPSDYPALFHLAPEIEKAKHIFDIGGNAGNLYYCYSQYLHFHEDLVWTVSDLPGTMEFGRRVAQERGVQNLRFTSNWADASGADILIASGSMHYFDRPLSKMVEELSQKPRCILINRTPLTDGAPAATIQDSGTFRVACMLYNRQALIDDFARIGYELRDEWRTPDRVLTVPGNPDYDIGPYSGMWLALR